MTGRVRFIGLAVAAAAAVSLVWVAGASAAQIHVSDDGDSGPNTLRAAIAAANVGGGDEIIIDDGTNPTLTLSPNGPIAINKSLTITGEGPGMPSISGSNEVRPFIVNLGVTVTMQNIQIHQGTAPAGPNNGAGENGGAILNNGTLTLSKVHLYDNRGGPGGPSTNPGVQNGFAGGSGGGVANTATGNLTVMDSTFDNGNEQFNPLPNRAGYGSDGTNSNTSNVAGGTGGTGGDGGAISSAGTLTVENSTFEGNLAGDGGIGGGAIVNTPAHGVGGPGGTGGDGGAIALTGVGAATIINSTFTGNLGGPGGQGGCAIAGNDGNGTTDKLTGGTGNTGGNGGGIDIKTTGSVKVLFNTVASNQGGPHGFGGCTSQNGHTGWIQEGGPDGSQGKAGGVEVSAAVTVTTVSNSIIANNTSANSNPNCEGWNAAGLTHAGNVTFLSASPASDGGCTGETVGNPRLGGLAGNGGLTRTMAPAAGSTAINHVATVNCLDGVGSALTEDQRHFNRQTPATGACDAGAVEYGATGAGGAGTPSTRLTGKPRRTVFTSHRRKLVRFHFGSSLSGSTFKCRIDRGHYGSCKSGKTYRLSSSATRRGRRHTFRVYATKVGVNDPSPVAYSFRIKRTG